MEKMDIAKGLIFKGLNVTSKESLEDRIMIQKKVYLLQQDGINLGYEYNWYLKGPYSPTLTQYVYDKLESLIAIDENEFSLNKKVKNMIEKVNKLKEGKPTNLDEASWYELLASILYISNENYMWSISKERDEVINILMKEKPKYSEEQSNSAFSKLIEYEYIGV